MIRPSGWTGPRLIKYCLILLASGIAWRIVIEWWPESAAATAATVVMLLCLLPLLVGYVLGPLGELLMLVRVLIPKRKR
jgi:hypothetical protein